MSVTDMCSYDRGGIWAKKAYIVPHEPHWHRLANGLSKGPKVNVLTEYANRRKALPAPNQYIKCRNW